MDGKLEYESQDAVIMAKTIEYIKTNFIYQESSDECCLVQTFGLKKGLRKFGQKGKAATEKEIGQLHKREVFRPINVKDLTEIERKRAMESLIFICEKRDGTIKARACANGSSQRPYTTKDEAASPTVATDAILMTSVMDAKRYADIMTVDIPNAFVQTSVPQGDEKTIMKIRGQLVDILLELFPGVYDEYVVYNESDAKCLYVEMLKALYGMLKSSLLYYKSFVDNIKQIGFELNPYDCCVANRMINGNMQTINWHVDDIYVSHPDPRVNTEFAEWCCRIYGGPSGQPKVARGKLHDFLAMRFDFESQPGAVKVDMRDYIHGMLEEFPYPVPSLNKPPWNERLIKVATESRKLDDERRSIFHTFTMKAMFLCKRGRPDIELAVSFFATRVQAPTENDWGKLIRLMGFLKGTVGEVLTLQADDNMKMIWSIDVAFAVHNDMKSHTGAVMSFGNGALCSSSTKQKVNARSSTEAELIGLDDKIAKIL